MAKFRQMKCVKIDKNQFCISKNFGLWPVNDYCWMHRENLLCNSEIFKIFAKLVYSFTKMVNFKINPFGKHKNLIQNSLKVSFAILTTHSFEIIFSWILPGFVPFFEAFLPSLLSINIYQPLQNPPHHPCHLRLNLIFSKFTKIHWLIQWNCLPQLSNHSNNIYQYILWKIRHKFNL